MGAPDETDPIDDFPAVADNFDIVQWLRRKGGAESVVEQYHALRGIPVQPVQTGLRLGEFLLTEEDPEVVAFGHDEHTFFMASTSILNVDPQIEPWRSLDVTAGEMRHVARNTKVGWEEFDWWDRGILKRRLSYGLDESDTGIQVGDPPDFEDPSGPGWPTPNPSLTKTARCSTGTACGSRSPTSSWPWSSPRC
ncbi:hypothetical protein [uncultured Serinicoccus sp.]|uniref:hypothetical protein n=1 Tax=uncultured Serinicoccus sp. TaxID=735514 RepID=UPI00262F1F1D|nr:hypothetical protein [uncultured Serinicoccus sp.]